MVPIIIIFCVLFTGIAHGNNTMQTLAHTSDSEARLKGTSRQKKYALEKLSQNEVYC